MGRDALVVGISTYSYSGLENLEAPATDAEAIAQRLESSSFPFRVERLPGIIDNSSDNLRTGKTTLVPLRQLETALVRYFKPTSETYSDTVLFYFSGHGLYDDLTGKSYLATSDTNPEDNRWGYALADLSRLLRDSSVKRQIVWLDCCHSGGLIAVKDANPGEQAGYSRCFVAASQAIESAYELASGSHGVLTDGLLQGLHPERVPGQWIDTLSLCAFVNQYLKDVRQTYPQRSLFLNVGESIDLIRSEGTETISDAVDELQVDVCPYRALNAFDFSPEDVRVFFGRRTLTDELLGQIYNHHFLAVLGASGSGKSSVVRAGLLHELQQGERRSGTETWRILPIIKPTESPLRSLAGAFIPEVLITKKRGEVLLNSSIADLKEQGATALVKLIEEEGSDHPVILVVDQFEEIFTLCRGTSEKEQERKQFLNCLFGALDALTGQFRLVITLRADFLGKCLEQSYENLAGRIKESRIDVTPLTDPELDEVIIKPAATVGLQVAPYLQERLKAHVEEAPGSLPLLQYALTELWRDWHTRYLAKESGISNQLTFEGYDRIGGVIGALEKQANAVYDSFADSKIQQGLVQRIFLELVQPGEETEDTRQRILKQELISEIHSESIVDGVLGKLVESRLIVIDEMSIENTQSDVVIDLAHEATIRHWRRLRYWLNKHRQDLPLIRRLRAEATVWQTNQQQSRYLLGGTSLDVALDCLKKYRELGYLNEIVQNFIRISREVWILEETEKEKQILEALCMTAEVQWNQHKQLESLLTLARAGKHLQQIFQAKPEIVPSNAWQVISKLQQTLYGRIQEKNRLEGHTAIVNAIAYSPDGETFASASSDQTVKVWNSTNGRLLISLEANSGNVIAVNYSPDGKTLASIHFDHTIKLWNVKTGDLIASLEEHQDKVVSVAYSPDSQTLASASWDTTVKLWHTLDGSLIRTLGNHNGWVNAVVFSPDGKIVASASDDKTVKLWNVVDGSLIYNQDHHGSVRLIAYSPSGKVIASASGDNTINLWSIERGNQIYSLISHNDRIKSIAYSLNGENLVSSSSDNTLKLWNLVDGKLISTLEGHSAGVNTAFYSPDGKIIFSASDDRTIRLWDSLNKSLIATLEGHDDIVKSMACSPDCTILASAGEERTIRFWYISSSRCICNLHGHRQPVDSVVYSPDGSTLASAGDDYGIKLWNAASGSLNYSLEGHDGRVNAIAFNPDGQILASGGVDRKVKIWDVKNGSLIYSLEAHSRSVKAVSFSPNGEILASASSDHTINLWNIKNASLIYSLVNHDGGVNTIVYCSDGKIFASASDNHTIQIWNAFDGGLIHRLEGHTHNVNVVVFSPDSKILASASWDSTIKIWDVKSGVLVHNLKGHGDEWITCINFSPDSKTLASASHDKTVKVWDVESGTLIFSLEGHNDGVNSVIYISDGRVLASASSDNTVRIWDIVHGTLVTTLEGHTGSVKDLAYNPNDKTLASAGHDATIKLWNVDFELDLDALMIQASNWLRDYLTHNSNLNPVDQRLLEN